MNKGLKKSFSVVLAFVVILGFIFSDSVKCFASNLDFDSNKNLYLFVLPYGGTEANDAALLSTVWSCGEHRFWVQGSLKYKNVTLGFHDKLESGKQYTYEGILEYTGSDDSFDFNSYKLHFIDELDKSHTGFLKESSSKVVDSDTLEFSCIIRTTDKPVLNRGTLYADFSAGNSYNYFDDTTDGIIRFLSCLAEEDVINVTNDIDGDIVKAFHCDLDKDGSNDLTCDFKTLYKSNACSLSDEITFNLPTESIEYYESKSKFYYDKIVINFADKSSSNNNSSNNNSSNNNSASNNTGRNDSNKGATGGSSKTNSYKNEWVDGQWYDENGGTSYTAVGSWKSDSKGWWFEDSSGWYPKSQWQKIDGKWYYFTDTGYMDYSEYRDGYWLGADGALVDGYYGQWKSDSKGWWFEDTSGWYPQSQWLWIDGVNYYFDADGYLGA